MMAKRPVAPGNNFATGHTKMTDAISIRQTADSICESRNEAMRLYREAHALIEQANAKAEEATQTVSYTE